MKEVGVEEEKRKIERSHPIVQHRDAPERRVIGDAPEVTTDVTTRILGAAVEAEVAVDTTVAIMPVAVVAAAIATTMREPLQVKMFRNERVEK